MTDDEINNRIEHLETRSHLLASQVANLQSENDNIFTRMFKMEIRQFEEKHPFVIATHSAGEISTEAYAARYDFSTSAGRRRVRRQLFFFDTEDQAVAFKLRYADEIEFVEAS